MPLAKLMLFMAAIVAQAVPASGVAQTLSATEQNVVRQGFAFPAAGPIRILVFRPDIKVGEQTTAGLFQSNAEWNDLARKRLIDALVSAKKARQFDVVVQDQPEGAKLAQYAEYRALFRVIVSSAIRHKLFGRDPLPGQTDDFSYSLGRGIGEIVNDPGAAYGLFLFSHDGFESPGRKAALLVSSLMGAHDTTESHFGYAALVDLKSGDLLWLNVDLKATGDVRTSEGAAQRIEQLLAGFPQRSLATAVRP